MKPTTENQCPKCKVEYEFERTITPDHVSFRKGHEDYVFKCPKCGNKVEVLDDL